MTESEETKAKLETLTETIRGLEGRMKDLESEWANQYTRIKRLTGIITKTAGVDRRREEEEDNSDSNSNSNSRVTGVHSTLQAMRAKHGLLPR